MFNTRSHTVSRVKMVSKLPPNSECSPSGFSAHYDLKAKIGEGTFAEVWWCTRRDTGQEAAAKVLKKNYGKNTEWSTISEVTVAKSVGKHPFLLTTESAYFDHGTGKIILVTELMKKSLYDLITEGTCPLPDNRIKTYMYQMLEGTTTPI